MKRKPKTSDQALIAMIRAGWDLGLSMLDIAKRLHVDEALVYNTLAKDTA